MAGDSGCIPSRHVNFQGFPFSLYPPQRHTKWRVIPAVYLLDTLISRDLLFLVPASEAQQKADDLGCIFLEVSAAEDYDNVQEALNTLFTKVSVHKKCLRQEKEKRKNTIPQMEKKKQKFGNSLFNWKNEKRRGSRRSETI